MPLMIRVAFCPSHHHILRYSALYSEVLLKPVRKIVHTCPLKPLDKEVSAQVGRLIRSNDISTVDLFTLKLQFFKSFQFVPTYSIYALFSI